jgi:hypothetical protein
MQTVEGFTNGQGQHAKLAGSAEISWLCHKSIHIGQLICRSEEHETNDARGI